MTMIMAIMIMVLPKVSKLLEEGRLREGVVLVNYRLIVKMMIEMKMMMIEMKMMIEMEMILAFCETFHTHM